MPYVGKSPVGGGFHKLDALTASATATYALTLNGAAYYPETANQLLVSLNGVIQACQDSFQVSGSNLIFDSALTANDSIDFVVALGDVLGVGSVTDGAVTTAKLGNNAVTDAKLANTLDLSGKALTMPSGSIIQVQYTQFTGTSLTATTSYTWLDIPDINVNITPTSTNSKIMVQMSLGGWEHSATHDHSVRFGFYRDSSLLVAPAAGSRGTAVGMGTTNYHQSDLLSTPAFALITYFDEPSTTNQITYKGAVNIQTSGNFVLNRTVQDIDAVGHERTVSSIIVTEIAG